MTKTHSPTRFGTRLGMLMLAIVAVQPFDALAADLLTFCLAAPPSEPTALTAYNSQCAAYLQSQLASPGTVAQNADRSAQIAQDQAQTALITSLAALAKAPSAQVASGIDISALGIAGLKKDAELTFAVAAKIGGKIGERLSAQKQALVVTSGDLAALTSSPVDATTVKDALDAFTIRLTENECKAKKDSPSAMVAPALMSIYGAQALLSAVATGASMFQPTLVGSGKIVGVTDAQNLIMAGLFSGMNPEKRAFLRINVPTITASNSILLSLGKLRSGIISANARLSNCLPNDPALKPAVAVLADAKEFLAALVKADATKPNLLDVAARRAALAESKIGYLLVLSRDVTGGGVAAVKKNWFTSTSLLLGTAVGISYRFFDFDGKVEVSGFESDTWADRCSFDQWTRSFKGCTADVRD